MENIITITDFELPNGGIYTGEAIDKGFGIIEIAGKGKAINPDGSSFEGRWKYSRPNGYGVYKFADGDYHKGYFDDTPNGVGYLCLNTVHQMRLGIYRHGTLNGWAISIGQGRFSFGWAQDGQLSDECLDETEWMQDFLLEEVFLNYSGNLIQISKEEFGYIRYGAPLRKNNNGVEHPAIGYTFYNDGTVIIGENAEKGNLNGAFVVCYPDHTILSGRWKDNQCTLEVPGKDVKATIQIQYFLRKFQRQL